MGEENGSNKNDELINFDEILKHIGQFGGYQKWIYFLACLIAIPSAFHAFIAVFTGVTMEHYCKVEGCDYKTFISICDNFSLSEKDCFESVQNYITPEDNQNSATIDESQCRSYINASCDYFLPGSTLNSSIYKINNDECKNWIYDFSQYESSIVSEWNLVCGNAVLEPLSLSMYLLGRLVGAIGSGIIADYIGRKASLMISLLSSLVLGIAVAFSPNFYTYVAFRFLVGAVGSGLFIISFVLGTEIVGIDYRTTSGIIIEFFYSFGYMLLTIMAFFIRDWRALQIATSAPLILFSLYIWLLPESPRWLISKKKFREAETIIKRIAVSNGTIDKLPNELFNSGSYKSEDKSEDIEKPESSIEKSEKSDINFAHKKSSFVDLFRYPNLRKKTLVLIFIWVVNTMVYYGLSINTSNLGGNDYLNAFISAAVEVPAYALTWWIVAMPTLGRRLPLVFTLGLAGVACLITPFPSLYNNDLNWLTITFSMIGKFSISASFAILYIFSVEVFPTPVRSVGMGMSSMFGRMGAIVAPYVVFLGDFWSPMPFLVFGLLSVFAGLLTPLLPETIGTHLPETVEQGESFGKTKDDKDPSHVKGIQELKTFYNQRELQNNVASISVGSTIALYRE